MKKLTALLTFVAFGFTQVAFCFQADEEMIPTVLLEETKLEASLDITEAKFVFTFRNVLLQEKSKVLSYSIDGVSYKATLNEGSVLEVMTTPGNHEFQFYYSGDYYEVYTGVLQIEPQHVSYYGIYLEESYEQIMTEKPVIYLYPEKDTTVSVKLKASGELTFTYPAYENGWEFKASPNGDLSFGDDTYNYLFWESSKRYALHSNAYASGYYVKGENATSFLKEKLDEAGLTSKEQTDFITYWAPRLAQNELNFVRFEFNETCDRFAELDITPKPDNLYRIYMLWHPTNLSYSISPQEIQKVNRDGFTVIEWGGQELPGFINRADTH